jgi:diguanylate cyclase (GGDEF)-like protein
MDWHKIAACLPDGLLAVDRDGVIRLANPAAHTLFGYPAGELVGQGIDALVAGPPGEAHVRSIVRKDGRAVRVSIQLSPLSADADATLAWVREAPATGELEAPARLGDQDGRGGRAELERRLRDLGLLHDLALLSVSGVGADILLERAREVAMQRLPLEDLRIEADRVSIFGLDAAMQLETTAVEVSRPLQVDDRSFGRVVAVFASPDEVGEEAEQLLDTLASQLALAMRSAELVRELEERAHTDALTQLNNRGRFMDLARAEVERAQRYQRSLCLVILDVDRFKSINDSKGHPYGDAVLQRLAAVLAATCRLSDVVARLGGDEFVALLPETQADGALRLVERLRAELARSTEAGAPSCTVSAGVAEFGLDHDDLHPMLRAADEALYEAKHKGRDRVAVRRSRRGSRKNFVLMRRSNAPPEG